ncbi:MAG: HAD family hydrolase [Chloroflexota bacterium]
MTARPAHATGPREPHPLLDGIDLVVFDKDGTLIDFDSMWTPWVIELTERLEAAAGRALADRIDAELGFDRAAGRAVAGQPLAIMPMGDLRAATVDLNERAGLSRDAAERTLDEAWFIPDPVLEAHPVTDLRALFASLRARGIRIAVATSDDHAPTAATLEGLGVGALVEALVGADDGIARKPAPDPVLHICAQLGIAPARTAVVGDSAADLAMGRAAGAARTIGVLTGVSGRQELEPYADAVVDSVAALADG